jgi:hypothetical protein
VFPCLFISSYGAESDILLTALLSAFVYYLAEYFGRPARASWRDAVRLGALGGLAMATKASGFAAPATLAVVFIARAITGPGRQTLMRHAAITLAAMSVLGAWKYVDNWRRHGTPFHLSGTGVEGFTAANRTAFVDRYEFATFRLGALERAIGPNIQTGTTLTALDVYKSVPTTLHALAWSDMSFFSVPSRHGASGKPYPWKFIPPRLTLSVILLGAVPAALALLGFVITLRHRAFLPLSVFGIISLAAYVWWFLPQPSWALKTKYVLFLLPQYVLYSVTGLAWLTRRIPIVAAVAWVLVAMLIVLCHLYLYAFAVGRL